jgi:RNA polymerase sigma-70 factor (ECF subfamily)
LCGFSTAEIAKSFLTSEDTVSKRLYRTKEFFRQRQVKLEIPSVEELKARTNVVLNSIYLLFNEGYNSTHSESLIRVDLVDESLLLCKLLIENEHTRLPETYALMALMCFHAARSESRLSPEGEIILLPHQDRSKWDIAKIEEGNRYMDLAAFGDEMSTYHLEAAIAFEHCTAPLFEETNWSRILFLYNWLCELAPSPVTALNRAVAVLQVEGEASALQALKDIEDRKKIESYYLYYSLLGEIYIRMGRTILAKASLEKAVMMTQSISEKKLLEDKIVSLEF